MKTNLLTLAATLLLAASVNTAFADDIYLVGPFNNWGSGSNTSDYKFNPVEGQSNVYTLTINNFGGVNEEQTRFKIKVGSSMLGVNGSTNYWLTKEHPNYSLVNNANASCLYLQFTSSYTFTLENDMLSVNLDDLLIAGNFNDWKPQRMTARDDGSYEFIKQDAYDGLEFKIVDFNNSWYCGGTGKTYGINDGWRSYISLSNSTVNSENFKLEGNPGACTFVVTSDFKLTVLGFGKNLVTLSDDKSNTLSTSSAVDVVINGRTLYGGEWNTLCLPFNVYDGSDADNTNFSGTLLQGAEVKTLSSSSFADGSLTLNFSDASTIEAGVPYIVKVNSDIVNPRFTNVTISATTPSQSGESSDKVIFQGCFDPTEISGSNNLYLGAANTLYYPSSSVTINSFRAYFKLNLPSGQQAKAFVLNFDDDNETTSIKQINNAASANDTYYTLDGRRLNDKPATAGLYIINGKKVVIK